MKVCSIPDCGEKHECKGYCNMHYKRWRKHGDPHWVPPSWRDLFWTYVEVTGFCWNWVGYLNAAGYGTRTIATPGKGKRSESAHRVAYELLVGPIPGGLQLDHLCRNTACVNPDHLEPVTPWENQARGFNPAAINARKTHCIRSHEFTPENTYIYPSGFRMCRECYRARRRGYYASKKAANGAAG